MTVAFKDPAGTVKHEAVASGPKAMRLGTMRAETEWGMSVTAKPEGAVVERVQAALGMGEL